MDLLGKAQVVHRVDEAARLDRLAHLVALQRSHHVPAQLRRRAPGELVLPGKVLAHLRRALHELLHAVLAEVSASELDQLVYLVKRCGLAHHHQEHLRWRAARTHCRLSDSRAHQLVALPKRSRNSLGIRACHGQSLLVAARLPAPGTGHGRHILRPCRKRRSPTCRACSSSGTDGAKTRTMRTMPSMPCAARTPPSTMRLPSAGHGR